jgi:hypothetical protein
MLSQLDHQGRLGLSYEPHQVGALPLSIQGQNSKTTFANSGTT